MEARQHLKLCLAEERGNGMTPFLFFDVWFSMEENGAAPRVYI